MDGSVERCWRDVLVGNIVWTFRIPESDKGQLYNEDKTNRRYKNNCSVCDHAKINYSHIIPALNTGECLSRGVNIRSDVSDYNTNLQKNVIIQRDQIISERFNDSVQPGSKLDNIPPVGGGQLEELNDHKENKRSDGLVSFNEVNEGLDYLPPLGGHNEFIRRGWGRNVLPHDLKVNVNHNFTQYEANIHKNIAYHSANKHHFIVIIPRKIGQEFTTNTRIIPEGFHAVGCRCSLIEDATDACLDRLQLIKSDLNESQVKSSKPQTAGLAFHECVKMNEHRNNCARVSGGYSSCVTTSLQRNHVSQKKNLALTILKRHSHKDMGNEQQQVKTWTKGDRISKKTRLRNPLQKTQKTAVLDAEGTKDRTNTCSDTGPSHRAGMSACSGSYHSIPGSKVPLRKWLEPRDDCDRTGISRMTITPVPPQESPPPVVSNCDNQDSKHSVPECGDFTAEICDKLDSLLGKDSHNNSKHSDLCETSQGAVNIPDATSTSVDLSSSKQSVIKGRIDTDHNGINNRNGLPVIDVTTDSDTDTKLDHKNRLKTSDSIPQRRGRLMGEGGEGGEEGKYLKVPDPWVGADPMMVLRMGLCENKEGMDAVKAMTARLKLQTRRPSLMVWRERLQDKPLQARHPDEAEDVDEEWTPERKLHISRSIGLLRQELIAMREMDQSLARQLVNIRDDLHRLKLQRRYEETKEIVEDAREGEEKDDIDNICDIPRDPFSPTLKQYGVTRMNINARRFSVY